MFHQILLADWWVCLLVEMEMASVGLARGKKSQEDLPRRASPQHKIACVLRCTA